MKKYLIFLILILGCTTDAPENLISEEKMESIIFDIMILNASYNYDLKIDNNLLSDELILSLTEILDLITKVYQDLSFNISFISTSPGSPTGMNPTNYNILEKRMREIQKVQDSFESFKSQNTKLV